MQVTPAQQDSLEIAETWSRISFNFPVTNAYDWIIIGNFVGDNSLFVTEPYPGNIFIEPSQQEERVVSYYFIDDVSLKLASPQIDQDTVFACYGDLFTIVASGLGDADTAYHWMDSLTGTQFPVANDTILMLATQDRNIIVYSYGLDGCVELDSMRLQVTAANLEIELDKWTCENDTSIFCLSGMNIDTVVWNTDPSWEYNLGTSYEVDSVLQDTTTTYCLNITDWGDWYTSGGYIYYEIFGIECSLTDSIWVTGCCLPDTGNLIFTDTTLIITGSQTMTGSFAINGTLYLDGGGLMTFSNAEVAMGANAEIHLLNGTDLTLTDSTHIYACYNIHNGIYASDSSRFIMNGYSLIEDARTAVSLRNEAYFNIDSARFLNNSKHLSIRDYPTVFNYGVPLIRNTTMLCTQNLAPPFGTYITGTAVEIMNNTVKWDFGPGVLIDSARTGMWIRNSTLTVLGDTIRNITNEISGGAASGTGIFSIGMGANVLTVDGCHILSNRTGIQLEDHNAVVVQNTTFDTQFIGAYYRLNGSVVATSNTHSNMFVAEVSTLNDDVRISLSDYTDNALGIISNFDGPDIDISNNTFTFTGTDSTWADYGILLMNNQPDCNGLLNCGYTANIYDNTMTNVVKGIYLKDVAFTRVYGNNINLRHNANGQPPNNWESRGIHADQSLVIQMTDNTVWSSAYSNNWRWWDTGIRTDYSVLVATLCNTTRNIHNGILNGGPAHTTYMFDNIMDSTHLRGIMQNYGVLGQQGNPTNPTDNQWKGTFQSHTDTYNMEADAQPFYARYGSQGTDFWPNPFVATAYPINSLVYQVNLDESNPGDTSATQCPVNFRNNGYLYRVVLDSITYSGADSLATERLNKLEVFRAVSMDSILQLDSILVAFKDTFNLTDLGKLDVAARQLDLNMTRGSASKLVTDVNAVVTEDTIGSIWKELLTMAYSKWADDDTTTVLSATDSTRLWDIGALCPYTNGPAVYLARTMLFSLDSAYFSLGNDCEIPYYVVPSGKRADTESEGTEDVPEIELEVNVYPNPSNGFVTVAFSYEPDEGYALLLYGIDGRKVADVRLNSRLTDVDMRSLNSGMYFVEILSRERVAIFKVGSKNWFFLIFSKRK